MQISDSYYKTKRKYKKLALGGQMDEEDRNAAIGMGAGMAGGLVDAFATPNSRGRVSTGGMVASGALKGASAGASLGPIGAAVGGVVGGVTGWIQGAKAKKQEEEDVAQEKVETTLAEQQAMNSRLMSNPQLRTGSLSAQYFANGGPIEGDPPAKKPLSSTDYQNWNRVVNYARSKKYTPDQLDHNPSVGYGVIDEYNKANPTAQFDRNRVKDIQTLMEQYRQKTIDKFKSYTPEMRKVNDPAKQFGADYSGFMPGLSKPDNFPGSKTLNWQVPSEYMTETNLNTGTKTTQKVGFAPVMQGTTSASPVQVRAVQQPLSPAQAYLQGQLSKKANGGTIPTTATKAVGGKLVPQSSDGVEVQGNTHAEGGVQIPGAEVEGGETIKDNFVYSAQLGFAQKSKPLMRAKGIIEKKPATPERINAIKRIEDKENQLAIAQEYIKKKYGLK